jgi:hypothetical protein
MSDAGDARNARADWSLVDLFVQYYRANGLGFGSADIICAGSLLTGGRIGLLVRVLLNLKGEGNPAISQFVVVALPTREDIAADQLRLHIEAAISGVAETADVSLSIASDQIRIARPPDLLTQSLLTIIREAEPRSVIIVQNAADYRTGGDLPSAIPEAPMPTLMEDFWVPQGRILSKGYAKRPPSGFVSSRLHVSLTKKKREP